MILRRYQSGDEHRVEPPDTTEVKWLLDWLAVAEHYHRYRVEGLEHIPVGGPALLVSYHSFTVVDMLLLCRTIFLRDDRVPRGLADTIVFKIPVLRDLFSAVGIVSGTRENGLALLARGEIAVCMPGGALEWSRSWRQRYQLRWADHRGYARLAIRARVPVIPTACPAADRVYLLPYDGWSVGEVLQRLLGLQRTLPLPLPLGLFGPIGFPVQLTQYVGEPIWPDAPPEAADDPDAVARFDLRVRQVIERFLARR